MAAYPTPPRVRESAYVLPDILSSARKLTFDHENFTVVTTGGIKKKKYTGKYASGNVLAGKVIAVKRHGRIVVKVVRGIDE